MYAQTDNITRSSSPSGATPTRAILRTRPRNQRILIRSWEYIKPVRTSILVIRLLVVLWLVFLAGKLMSMGNPWGLTLLPAAVGVLGLSFWVFTTAAKGWPVAEA